LRGDVLSGTADRAAVRAAIVGISGLSLTTAEVALFAALPPAGAILFRRNVADPDQVRALTDSVRAVLPANAPILVDQEGGRVARLRPPAWRAHPPAAVVAALHDRDAASGLRAAWLTGALIGLDCAAVGIDVVCAPVLDLRLPETHAAIGDRAYSSDPETVAALGRAMAAGLLAAGVQPVGKHAPGHGRAAVDSHLALPVVQTTFASDMGLAADLVPFARNADLPWMLTAHIRYPALDPERPATLSPTIVGDIIRGRIGFAGVLASDDLAMEALAGSPADRATAALAAGCDLALYCPGDPEGNAAVLAACPVVTEAALARLAVARALAAARRVPLDGPALADERDGLLA
jgi:beta-N-acetylhexosaminidase